MVGAWSFWRLGGAAYGAGKVSQNADVMET